MRLFFLFTFFAIALAYPGKTWVSVPQKTTTTTPVPVTTYHLRVENNPLTIALNKIADNAVNNGFRFKRSNMENASYVMDDNVDDIVATTEVNKKNSTYVNEEDIVPVTEANIVSTSEEDIISTTEEDIVPVTEADIVSTTEEDIVSTTEANKKNSTYVNKEADTISTTEADIVSTTEEDIISTTEEDIVPVTEANIVSTTEEDIISTTEEDIVPVTEEDIVSTTEADIVSTTEADIVSTTEADIVSTTEADIVATTEEDIVSTTEEIHDDGNPLVTEEEEDDDDYNDIDYTTKYKKGSPYNGDDNEIPSYEYEVTLYPDEEVTNVTTIKPDNIPLAKVTHCFEQESCIVISTLSGVSVLLVLLSGAFYLYKKHTVYNKPNFSV